MERTMAVVHGGGGGGGGREQCTRCGRGDPSRKWLVVGAPPPEAGWAQQGMRRGVARRATWALWELLHRPIVSFVATETASGTPGPRVTSHEGAECGRRRRYRCFEWRPESNLCDSVDSGNIYGTLNPDVGMISPLGLKAGECYLIRRFGQHTRYRAVEVSLRAAF